MASRYEQMVLNSSISSSVTSSHTTDVEVLPIDASSNQESTRSKTPTLNTQKYTPFGKTPRSRRVKLAQPRTRGQDAEQFDNFSGLVDKTWRMYRLSPLHNFDSSNVSFKKYCRQLSAHVRAEVQKGIAVDASEVSDFVEFKFLEGLKKLQHDNEAIEITMKKHAENGAYYMSIHSNYEGEKDKTLMVAMLCCVHGPTHLSKLPENYTAYPLLLCRGLVSASNMFNSWLQAQFDTHVSSLMVTADILSWMIAMWSGWKTGRKLIELVYKVPNDVKSLSNVTISIDSEHAYKLWASIHKESSAHFTEEEMDLFHKNLKEHIAYNMGINLSSFSLQRIMSPVAMVGTESKLKLLSKRHVQEVLFHLTSLATEQIIPPS